MDIDEAIFREYFHDTPPDGKYRITGDDGMPAWADVPPPTREEQIASAETKKQQLINQANDYMNSRQWAGKAAIGRLKGEELAQYNLWLDYLDALELVDTSGAPDIEWPTPPAVQAR
ncbi:tail fiber assembly protein [Escherichia coli]|nr:tail fiber assembly protein [Escherichia coli]